MTLDEWIVQAWALVAFFALVAAIWLVERSARRKG